MNMNNMLADLLQRKSISQCSAGLLFLLVLIYYANTSLTLVESDIDEVIPSQLQLPNPTANRRISSFMDLSWASMGKDATTQFETLLPPSDIDYTIENRVMSMFDDSNKCDDILLYMPYALAVHGSGQGSQLNNYLLASLVATYLNKALVLIENDRGVFNLASQFGCPKEAFSDESSFLNFNGLGRVTTVEGFPAGLSRLIQHPKWISRGCEIPTCGENYAHNEWEAIRRGNFKELNQNGTVKDFTCNVGNNEIKVLPIGGFELIKFVQRVLWSNMIDRSQENSVQLAYNWALRLGATAHEAKVFSRLTVDTEIYDFLLALISRSGLLRFQPWIARDSFEYIKSSEFPLSTAYDAIHVRRGDKLVKESRDEVKLYWKSKGYKRFDQAPTNFIPFSHYLERGWDGTNCKADNIQGTIYNDYPARLVYVATDDPKTVLNEIALLPKAKDGAIIVNECYRLKFHFSPEAYETNPSFHISADSNNCLARYNSNIRAVADFLILARAEKFVGEYNSNWGRLIRVFRTTLSDRLNALGDDIKNEMAVHVRETVVAFGPEHPLCLC